MRKSIRANEAADWIKAQRDFYVRASSYCREAIGIEHSFEGRNVDDSTPLFIPQGQMPDDDYYGMVAAMNNHGVVYVVLSYLTVIGWVDGNGEYHVMRQRYSLSTTQHQRTLWHTWGVSSLRTERVDVNESVKIGRASW